MRTGWLKLLFSGPLDLPGSKVRPPFAGIEESLRAWRARVAPNEWPPITRVLKSRRLAKEVKYWPSLRELFWWICWP